MLETSDWISLGLALSGLGLCAYIALDGIGYFKKLEEARKDKEEENE